MTSSQPHHNLDNPIQPPHNIFLTSTPNNNISIPQSTISKITMSSDSLAILRRNIGPELAQLAENHIQHDLRESDREALNSAAKKLSTYTTVGSLVGLGLGAVLAFRVRSVRAQAFKAIRAVEKPTHVRFADGREGMILDS
jgi:hypothetical protein